MRKRRIGKRILCFILSSAAVIQVAGCGTETTSLVKKSSGAKIEPMEIEEAANYSFDFIGGTDVMPIMGYYGPNTSKWSTNGNDAPDFLTDEMFELIAGTGINVISQTGINYKNSPELVIKMLELGEKYNVGITVSDERIVEVYGSKTPRATSVEELDLYLKDYCDYKSFVGSYVIDEPGMEGFFAGSDQGPFIRDYGELLSYYDQLGVYAYTNLFSNLSHTHEKYAEYVDAWVKTAKPKYLQFDQYLFDSNEGLVYAPGWFKTMEVIRKAAEEINVPFWVFVQAGAQWNDAATQLESAKETFPSRGEFLWNVGAALAFGAKGIDYFVLIQPSHYAWSQSTMYDFTRSGMIGAYGNKNRWYYYAQEINAQIRAVDHVLMNSVNKGVIASGKTANSCLGSSSFLIEGTSWRELKNVDGDAMIGCFNYLGKTALYVVNFDTEYAQHITLDFVDEYSVLVTQNAEEKRVSTDSLTLTLSAGNSALVVFE